MPMTVTLTTSGGSSNLTGTVTVAAACNPANLVSSVKFYVDGVQHSAATAAPYSFSWDTTAVTPGAHQLKATVSYIGRWTQASATLDVTVLDMAPAQPPPPPPPQDVPVLVPEGDD